jgi:hypothetical protein
MSSSECNAIINQGVSEIISNNHMGFIQRMKGKFNNENLID